MAARQRSAGHSSLHSSSRRSSPTPVTAHGAPTLTVADTTTLVEDGDGVLARVAVSCPEGTEVHEAHLRISQDEQTVSGEAPIFGIICDGRTRTRSLTRTPSGTSTSTRATSSRSCGNECEEGGPRAALFRLHPLAASQPGDGNRDPSPRSGS